MSFVRPRSRFRLFGVLRARLAASERLLTEAVALLDELNDRLAFSEVRLEAEAGVNAGLREDLAEIGADLAEERQVLREVVSASPGHATAPEGGGAAPGPRGIEQLRADLAHQRAALRCALAVSAVQRETMRRQRRVLWSARDRGELREE